MVAFALDWLDNLYGAGLKRAAGRRHATNWNAGALGARRDVGGGAGRDSLRAAR